MVNKNFYFNEKCTYAQSKKTCSNILTLNPNFMGGICMAKEKKGNKGKENSVLNTILQTSIIQGETGNLGNLLNTTGTLGQLQTVIGNALQNTTGTLDQVQNVVGSTLQNAVGTTLDQVQTTVGNVQNTTGTIDSLQTEVGNTLQNTVGNLSLMSIASSLETILSQLQNNKKARKNKKS